MTRLIIDRPWDAARRCLRERWPGYAASAANAARCPSKLCDLRGGRADGASPRQRQDDTCDVVRTERDVTTVYLINDTWKFTAQTARASIYLAHLNFLYLDLGRGRRLSTNLTG